jgi:pimeloyl-ACP methyl ester carboxylesterase
MTSNVTAGFRNAEWTLSALPEGTAVGVYPLRTADGAATNGFLYRRGAPKAVVCIMHPREFLATHYMIPPLIEAGYGVFTQTPRAVGSDLRLEHEVALLDVAAGMTFLRTLGIAKTVLLGNSGGSGLYCLYNEQSLLAPEKRFERTPGGRPVALAKADMPSADAVVLLSPHPGQGQLLMNAIDPSVQDEADPFSVDSQLDPFSPANGFADAPDGARYAPEFVERYRRAQRTRVEALDAVARKRIAERLAARKSGDRRRGSFQSVMTIWRTDADLRCWDLQIDPSDRNFGSLWGRDPFSSNYGAIGFARLCTPESWLSTWSGVSSKAALSRTAPAIEQPALMVHYTGDQTLFPSDAKAIFAAIGSADKTIMAFRGDHHGRALAPGEPDGREQAGREIGAWLQAHCTES